MSHRVSLNLKEKKSLFTKEISLKFAETLGKVLTRRGIRTVLAVLEHQLDFHNILSQSINKIAGK